MPPPFDKVAKLIGGYAADGPADRTSQDCVKAWFASMRAGARKRKEHAKSPVEIVEEAFEEVFGED